MTIEKLFDMVIIEEWARTHCGSAKEVRAQCVGLSNTSTKYITQLLEELAAAGRIPVTTVDDRYIGRSMNQINKLIAEGKL
jgi:hypothetical protein